MKAKIFIMMFLTVVLGVVLTYVSFSLVVNREWSTYEFLNANKEYGIIPIIAGFFFGIISVVNLICTLIYTHDQDCIKEESPKWFLTAYSTILTCGLVLALVVYLLSFLNILIVILLVLFSIFGLTITIKFFDEIKTWIKSKFVSNKQLKPSNSEFVAECRRRQHEI